MTDTMKLKTRGFDLHLQKGKDTRVPLFGGGFVKVNLDRTLVVKAGKLMTIKGDVVIAGEKPKVPRIVRIPTDKEWRSRGIALTASPGRWDHQLSGHAASDCLVLPDGSVAIYYVGSSGERYSDSGPAFRAVGVAISKDGLPPFKRSSIAPIVTWIDQGPVKVNQEEEGVYSCAVVQADEIIWMFYGAIESTGPGSVDVHIQVARSTDGIKFTHHGRIPGVDTTAGELWPFSAVYRNGVFFLWAGRRGRVDLLTGSDPYKLTGQRPSGLTPNHLRELGTSVLHRGGGFLAALYHDAPMRAARASVASPTNWADVETFRMAEGVQGKCWLLDRSRARWLLYSMRKDNKAIRVWTAPAR